MRIYRVLGILTMSSILSAQPIAFIARSRTPVGANPVSLAIGAFTGDATTDLIVADQGAAMLSVLRGLGNGFFQPLNNPPTGISPHAVVAGDFNRDGRLDLAVANFASNSVSVLLGTGAGTFRIVANLAARGPTGVAVGDFNADGKLDLSVTETNSNTVAIF